MLKVYVLIVLLESEHAGYVPIESYDSVSMEAGYMDSIMLAGDQEIDYIVTEPVTDSWPWSSIDVTGSAQLSRLFDALQIYCSPVNSLSLMDTLVYEATDGNQEFVSGSELHVVPLISNLQIEIQAPNAANVRNTKDTFGIPFLAAQHVLPPSPFNELYPFPSPAQENSRGNPRAVILDVSKSSLEAQANHIKTYHTKR